MNIYIYIHYIYICIYFVVTLVSSYSDMYISTITKLL